MKYITRKYLSLIGDGDINVMTKIVKEISNKLQPIFRDSMLTGYGVAILNDSERIEFEMLEEAEILFISEGKLPVIYAIVSFPAENIDETKLLFEDLETEFELRMFNGFGHT